MGLDDDEAFSSFDDDVYETVGYPREYVLVHAYHLLVDSGHDVRMYDPKRGRLMAHHGEYQPYGFHGWTDVHVQAQSRGTWVCIASRAYYPSVQKLHRRRARELWEDLRFRMENEYTAKMDGAGTRAEVRIHEMWRHVFEDAPAAHIREPALGKALGLLSLIVAITIALITFLYTHMDVDDYFPRWYGLYVFVVPPVMAMGLVLSGRHHPARLVFDWGQFLGIFVLAIVTLGVAYWLLLFPTVVAGYAIGELESWKRIGEQIGDLCSGSPALLDAIGN